MDETKLKFSKKYTLLGGLLIGTLVLYFFTTDKKITKFDQLALDEDVSVQFGVVNNYKIHCTDLTDINECLTSYKINGNNLPVTIWLGNSQLHSINQFKPGDETSSIKLHRNLKRNNQFLITLSQPNANLQEHLLLALYLVKKLPVEKIILPVVFDDMRENNIRKDIENIFEDDEAKDFITNSSKTANNLYQNYLRAKNNYSNYEKNNSSFQKKSEIILNKNLSQIWSLWSDREYLRGRIYNFLYRFRNFVFRIDPLTIRNMIPGHYLNNFNALKDIIFVSNKNSIKTFIYIAPIRSDLKIPYNLKEYNKFKYEIKNLSKKNNINFRNFEKIVPNNSWGNKDSTTLSKKKEIDFMHFKSVGHELLADAIYDELIKN